MYIRQYPKGKNRFCFSKYHWYNSKVTTLDGNLYYTNDQYINYFINEIIKICNTNSYQIQDHNKLKEEIENFIYKISDNT